MLRPEIQEYGKDILESEIFKKALKTPHHLGTTTIGSHSLSVAERCLRVADKYPGLKLDRRMMVRAALCHDLGLTDRPHCNTMGVLAFSHPVYSVILAKEFNLNLTKEEERMISRHMFPLSRIPDTMENWVLVYSDKYCADREIITLFRRKKPAAATY
ncbi:MAG: HD domain-containing protein [Lachnospiraceae bacterium]|nr:HD domain-containing protein [Lachnospiraceae bacterium]